MSLGQGRPRPAITDARLVAAGLSDQRRGLLGWICCRYGEVVIDGIALRRTRDERLVLAFPERRDAAGRSHPIVRPIDDAARRALEAAVLAALGYDGPSSVQSPGREDAPTRPDGAVRAPLRRAGGAGQ